MARQLLSPKGNTAGLFRAGLVPNVYLNSQCATNLSLTPFRTARSAAGARP
jgi:hypothetical protein